MMNIMFKNGTSIKGRLLTCLVCIFVAMSAPVQAQTLDEAARKAARQNDAKVLSARTVKDGKQEVHVIKLLTKDGVVKTVRVPVRKR